MSEAEISQAGAPPDDPAIPREPAQPIESRFLFVDVAALRAKQLRRGAKARLADGASENEHTAKPAKAERVAMLEVRHGLVEWDLPDFKAVIDTR